jgi:hypothetical protein
MSWVSTIISAPPFQTMDLAEPGIADANGVSQHGFKDRLQIRWESC